MIVHYPRHPRSDREAAMGLTAFRDRMFCPDARVRESQGQECRTLVTAPIS
jgi:hypothetical protein